jgi:hypothetical protein
VAHRGGSEDTQTLFTTADVRLVRVPAGPGVLRREWTGGVVDPGLRTAWASEVELAARLPAADFSRALRFVPEPRPSLECEDHSLVPLGGAALPAEPAAGPPSSGCASPGSSIACTTAASSTSVSRRPTSSSTPTSCTCA